jgi:peptide-methionine (S)-S-oxide reductase
VHASPCLHADAATRRVAQGEKASFDVPPAEAFGESNPMMGPVDLPATAAPPGLEAGMMVQLSNGAKARVTAVTAESVTINANPPLAGATLKLDIELLSVEPGAKSLAVADFALGCFWGAELAFQREPGVIATKVGYTQGQKDEPTYEEVCSGLTGHTECVQVSMSGMSMSLRSLICPLRCCTSLIIPA